MSEQRMALRALRRARGLSLDDLWVKTGLDRGLMSRLERGIGRPSAQTRARLAEFFDLPEDFLFPSEGGKE